MSQLKTRKEAMGRVGPDSGKRKLEFDKVGDAGGGTNGEKGACDGVGCVGYVGGRWKECPHIPEE